MNDYKLSQHFWLSEFLVSQTATRLGIDNYPDEDIIIRLEYTAERLETVRRLLGGRPIVPSSVYRCPQLNAAIGGSATSAHMSGFAVDFSCPGFGSPREVWHYLEKTKYDQLILEFDRWVHISFDPNMRQEFFEIN